MADSEDLIHVRWHIDRSKDPCEYVLKSSDPNHEDLFVSVSSADMTERVAKARLMEKMYTLGREKGISPNRLRFKINGVEE